MQTRKRAGRGVALGVAALGLAAGSLAAQSLEGTGVVPTGLLLRQLDGVKRVLMIGAHPDDEDTGLLTAMARTLGAETAYLSVTRGDGGQNLIGPELWEGLGIIRTGELESARRLDGGRQFFTRAFDFGYSKTAEESLTFWPHEEVLRDVVWVIRSFRPHVVVAVWTGTERDGHGQHQATGILTREAFDVAGDPARFPEQLARGVEAWAPAKLYLSGRRRPSDADVVLQVGALDPLLGRSAHQLAMESRSQHRSQDMGAPQPPGPRLAGAILEESRVDIGGDLGLFAGIDTTLTGLADALPAEPARVVRPHLEAYRESLVRAHAAFGLDLAPTAAALMDGLRHLQQARSAAAEAAGTELRGVLEQRLELAQQAYLAAAGVVVDVRADDDLVIPGQAVRVRVLVWNGGVARLRGVTPGLRAPDGWTVRLVSGGDPVVEPQSLGEWNYEVRPPRDAAPSRLYYLERERDGQMYRWPDRPSLWGLPRDPAPVRGVVDLSVGSELDPVDLRREVPWRFVGVSQARGEFTRPVLIVPALSATVSPGRLVWPAHESWARALTVALRNEARDGRSGTVRLVAPQGWTVVPESREFSLDGEGAERAVTFQVRPPAALRSGEHTFRAVVTTPDGASYEESMALVDYEHIERVLLFERAEARVRVVPVRVASGLRVGYVMGTGDDGPEAIRQMGADVTLLDEDAVRDGAFGGYDVLVLGVRAYETRADLLAANAQVLEFARSGGTVVVQYNQYQFARGQFAPYPFDIRRPADRVADETAPVRVLAPDAPVFTTPNPITAEDFEGWVQERGLYFMSEWSEEFTPMLEMADPGEDPKRGSLLVAPVGEGLYVYTALSFFRQWAAAVPGAYRLFANLISLRGEDWRTYHAASER